MTGYDELGCEEDWRGAGLYKSVSIKPEFPQK